MNMQCRLTLEYSSLASKLGERAQAPAEPGLPLPFMLVLCKGRDQGRSPR
jgi:hypothetical protein